MLAGYVYSQQSQLFGWLYRISLNLPRKHGDRSVSSSLFYLNKSEYRPCAFGIMVKDENNERGKIKEKSTVQGSPRGSSSIAHLCVIGYPSRSAIPPWSWYYAVTLTEVEGWFKESYSEPLANRSSPLGSRTIWGSRKSRWLISHFIRSLDDAPSTPLATDAVELNAECDWFEIKVWPCLLDSFLLVIHPDGGRWESTFFLGTSLQENRVWYAGPLEAFQEMFRASSRIVAWDTHSRPWWAIWRLLCGSPNEETAYYQSNVWFYLSGFHFHLLLHLTQSTLPGPHILCNEL